MKISPVESSFLRAKAMSFKKRKDTVMKKSMELSILCDVPVAAIVLGPNGELETFPENQDQLKALLLKYKPIASHYILSSSSSADSLIGLMNQLDAKIAAVDQRIELMKNISAVNAQSCSGGIGVQELLGQPCWFATNGAVGQGLACGLSPWSQNLGPDSITMVQDVVPLQVVEPDAADPATALGCISSAAAATSATSLLEGVASSSTTAGCESFGYAEDCFLENILLWDLDEQQPHVFDDADDDGSLDFWLNCLNQEPVFESN